MQLFDLDYFCPLFIIYCNKIREIISYCYKLFKTINCLLQHICYCIKVVIEIFEIYCNFFFAQNYYSILDFITIPRINYCNDSYVIAKIFSIVIYIFSCSVFILSTANINLLGGNKVFIYLFIIIICK